MPPRKQNLLDTLGQVTHELTKTESLHKTYTSSNKVKKKSQHKEGTGDTQSYLYPRSYLLLIPTANGKIIWTYQPHSRPGPMPGLFSRFRL